jgi:Transglutaminase-like superfamily
VEACVRLVLARLLLRLFSFRQLTRFFSLPLRKTLLSEARHQQLRRDVSWAIQRAARCLPGKTCCFPQGIAAQIMCRKRGIDTIMYYGAAMDPVAGLTAHVWVQDGSNGVVGHLIADKYGVLARFPA